MKNNDNSLRPYRLARIIPALLLVVGVLTLFAHSVVAQDADELRNKIDQRSDRIEQLEQEIEQFENRLQDIQGRKQTLQNKIEQLEVSQQRLNADISLTQEKIDETNHQIQQLTSQISDKQSKIEQQKKAIGEALRTIDEVDTTSLAEKMLLSKSLADIWETVDTLEKFQQSLQRHVTELKSLKVELGNRRDKISQKKQELVQLQEELQGKRQVLEQQEEEQDQLLAQTENRESNYQSLLAEKRQKKQQFEQELQQFEAQLEVVIDKGRLPDQGSEALSYPVNNVRITQYFGNTQFAQSGAYNGRGHNGTDFGAPVGTAVKSAASGKVVGYGNTDRTCPGASYGKWVLVEHPNGLSTLYAHLSLIKASRGESVNRGEIIGYSGNTGYSTGPHLHFSVYASQGVRIDTLNSNACAGATYTLPLAPFDAYQNPLDYLPNT